MGTACFMLLHTRFMVTRPSIKLSDSVACSIFSLGRITSRALFLTSQLRSIVQGNLSSGYGEMMLSFRLCQRFMTDQLRSTPIPQRAWEHFTNKRMKGIENPSGCLTTAKATITQSSILTGSQIKGLKVEKLVRLSKCRLKLQSNS